MKDGIRKYQMKIVCIYTSGRSLLGFFKIITLSSWKLELVSDKNCLYIRVG